MYVTAPHSAFLDTCFDDIEDAVGIINAEIYDAELDACLVADY